MHFDKCFEGYISTANNMEMLEILGAIDSEMRGRFNAAAGDVLSAVKNNLQQPEYLKEKLRWIEKINSEEHKKIYVQRFMEGTQITIEELENQKSATLVGIFLKQIDLQVGNSKLQQQLPAPLMPPRGNEILGSFTPSAPPPPPPQPVTPMRTPDSSRTNLISTPVGRFPPGVKDVSIPVKKGAGLPIDHNELLKNHQRIMGGSKSSNIDSGIISTPTPQASTSQTTTTTQTTTPQSTKVNLPRNRPAGTPLNPRAPATPQNSNPEERPRTPYRVSKQQTPQTPSEEIQTTQLTPQTINGKTIRVRDRDPSFLTKGKKVENSTTIKAQAEIAEAEVNVKDIIARLEAMFNKSLEENQLKVDRLLAKLLDPTNNPMLRNILGTSLSGEKAIIEKITPVFKEVAAEVIVDFNKCWITKEEFGKLSEEEARSLLLTPDKLLRGVPEGMSISILLRDAWLRRSYEKCLNLNYQRNLAKKGGDSQPDTEEMEVALNLYKYFFTHLDEIEKIHIYAEVGKTIRNQEMLIVGVLRNIEEFTEEMKDYIENGNPYHSCSENFFHVKRVPQPDEADLPDWLKGNLE